MPDFQTHSARIRLNEFATNVYPGRDGICGSRSSTPISYPEDSNDLYARIEENSFWFRHRNRVLGEVLDRFPPAGPLFDIGGGNGFVSLALQNKGLPVVLVEPGPMGASNAARRGIENVICSTLDDAGFLPGVMDAAGAFDVVEHVADDIGFLKRIAESLKPGGLLYLTVPAFQALWSQEDEHTGHYRRYTTASLNRTLTASGFAVRYLTYFFQWLPAPIFLARSLPYRCGYRFSPESESRRIATEHRAPRLLDRPIEAVLARELAAIRSGKTLQFGSSCLAVATKC